MFTWICPKCKMEVPPHLSECPNCAGTPETAAAPVPAAPPAAQAPPAKVYAPPPASGLPAWLVTVIAAGVLVGLGALGYFFFLPGLRGEKAQPASAATKVETPGAKAAHPYSKFIEVTGIRVAEDKKKNVQIRMDVVNHSMSDLTDMEIKVDIRSASAKPGDPPLCEVLAKVPALGPQESKDVTATGKTQFRAYELPDWQFLRVDYEIVSPKL